MRYLYAILASCFSLNYMAQSADSTREIKVEGYLEPYFCFDFNQPGDHTRPDFIYSHHRHNEINVNLALVRASVSDSNYRGAAGLMSGTYTQTNLAAEPIALRNIFEAWAGVKLSRKHSLWMDVGIFPSHIGFESAIGKNCVTATRSILADNTPYFETGIKLGFTSRNERWNFQLLVLNGWQKIYRAPDYSLPAFGTQVTYNNGWGLTVNSSTFIGSVYPDYDLRMRYFHNFYCQLVKSKFSYTLGFDFGMEQAQYKSGIYYKWFSPVIIAGSKLTDRLSCALRCEGFHDYNEVIVTTNTRNGFQVFGYSLNFDYKVASNVLVRLEGKGYHSKDAIFNYGPTSINYNYCVVAVLAASI